MELIFVTGNENKFLEAKKLLDPIKLEQKKIYVPELQGDPDFIAEEKAKYAFNELKHPLFVEDTSVEFEAMNGFPGAYIKDLVEKLGNNNIPKLLYGFDNKNAVAAVRVAYIEEVGKPMIFKGIIKGKIVEPKGSSKFDWDPIFMPDGYDQTFAELGTEEKNKISHRRKAFMKFKEWILENRSS